MPRHKDFEIWWDEERQRYRFTVEYWGGYSAPTMEQIQKKVERVRLAVKIRLAEIEKENKAYYARLAKEEEEFKRSLKRLKESANKKEAMKFYELSAKERKALLRMIDDNCDEEQIKNRFDINAHTIAALKQKRKENVFRDV